MMGKIFLGSSFRRTIDYCLNDKLIPGTHESIVKDRAEIIHYNCTFGNREEIIRQFNEVRKLNTRLSSPVLHIALSLPPGETRQNGDLAAISRDCADYMQFGKNQYLTILHKDTPHQHIHIVANRIGFDKQTVPDSFSYGRMADFCRLAEIRHQLRQEPGPRRYRSQTQQLTPPEGIRLDRLRDVIEYNLQISTDLPAFCHHMQRDGYQVFTERGIAFRDEKNVCFKGCDAGYPLHSIQNTLLANNQYLRQWERQLLQKTTDPEYALEKPLQHHSPQLLQSIKPPQPEETSLSLQREEEITQQEELHQKHTYKLKISF